MPYVISKKNFHFSVRPRTQFFYRRVNRSCKVSLRFVSKSLLHQRINLAKSWELYQKYPYTHHNMRKVWFLNRCFFGTFSLLFRYFFVIFTVLFRYFFTTSALFFGTFFYGTFLRYFFATFRNFFAESSEKVPKKYRKSSVKNDEKVPKK